MVINLIEGQWAYRVDEKRRFPVPPKIRSKFGKTWVMAFDPEIKKVALFPLKAWQDKVSKVKNSEQLRLEWYPFQTDLDAQGRINIPRKLKELGELGQMIVLISMGERIILKNVLSDKSYLRRN